MLPLITRGNQHFLAGRLDEARALYDQALAEAHRISDPGAQGDALGNLGNCHLQAGDFARAADFYRWALEARQTAGDRAGEGRDLSNLGNCLASLGQTAEAQAHFERALAIARALGDRPGEAARLSNLGNCQAELGRPEQARALFEQALAIERAGGDPVGVCADQVNLANALIDLDECAAAARLVEDSLQSGQALGLSLASAYATLALTRLILNDLPAARAAAESALTYDEPLNNPANAALLGILAARQADSATAERAFRLAAAAADRLLAQTDLNHVAWDARGLALTGLALLHPHQTDLPAAAAEAFRAARRINANPGVAGRAGRLLDALAPVGLPPALQPARAAARI